MTSSLQFLFEQIDRLKEERDLRSQVVPQVGEHFAATQAGIFFFDELSKLNPNLQKILKVALSIRQGEATPTSIIRWRVIYSSFRANPPQDKFQNEALSFV